MQERAGVREEAARIGAGVRASLSGTARLFLERQAFAVAASLDSEEAVWASPLSGPPGFMRPVDDELVRIDARYADEGLLENLRARAPLGLLVIDLAARRRMRVNGRALVEGDAIYLHLSEAYPNCPRYIHPRRLVAREVTANPSGTGAAPALRRRRRSHTLDRRQRQWISRADTFFVASSHPEGGPDASHRGGDPGFVRVDADGTLEFPDYPGNNMFNTLGNLAEQPRAGLLFLDFESGDALQLTGEGALDWRPEALRAHPGADKVVVRFAPRAVVEVRGGGVRGR